MNLEMAIAGDEADIILITEILPKSHCNTITAVHISLSHYQLFLKTLIRLLFHLVLQYVVLVFMYQRNYFVVRFLLIILTLMNKCGSR